MEVLPIFPQSAMMHCSLQSLLLGDSGIGRAESSSQLVHMQFESLIK